MSDQPSKSKPIPPSEDEGEIYLFPATLTDIACAVRATSMEDAQKQAADIRAKSKSSIS